MPTVSAVIITRNRIDTLRKTLISVQQSVFPLAEIVVTDDSSDTATQQMLAAEFPAVLWTRGPHRGITANRNHGIRVASGDFILLLDDDLLVDPEFVKNALQAAQQLPNGVFFPTMLENGQLRVLHGIDFLGFSSRPYAPGEPYHTANCQCIVISRSLAIQEPWDEVVSAYGYEEMEYGYRIAAGGCPLVALSECVCTHLAPNPSSAFRIGPDANRLYVTFKRYLYVDRSAMRALLFILVAVPHHIVARVRRAGWKGLGEAWSNLRLALLMLRQSRHAQKAQMHS